MQWWNDFVDWLNSSAAQPAVFNAAVLAIAVIVSGLLAAWIARGALRGLLSRTDRQQKASAIAALVDAATEASVWNSLTPAEQVLSDRAVGQADILVRLLPIKGAGIAATWAGHQLAEMKRASATFGYQLDPAVAEFRDRLIEWQNKPGRARRIFQGDLERWRFESADPGNSVLAQQDAWVAQQHHEQYAAPAVPATEETVPAASYAPVASAPAAAAPEAGAPAAHSEAAFTAANYPTNAAANDETPLPVSAFASSDNENDTTPNQRYGQPVS
ncbi:hypothetical protein [Leifsonia shinshuensis]|uniref:hypothetical protein n=1 Tax=Leifsonia shinshuensis TaxID=150026 RepID=UPI002156034F|nr:hypothetical protein [Leifsonia shinshuensis]